MTAEIINLRQARKRRARDQKEAKAAENRAHFGRGRAEREQADLTLARAAQALDGHLRDSAVGTDDSALSASITPADDGPPTSPAPKSPSRTPQ